MQMTSMMNGEAIFGATTPVVQKAGKGSFLTDNPNELFVRGQFLRKPILAGVVAQEGSFIVGGSHSLIGSEIFKLLFLKIKFQLYFKNLRKSKKYIKYILLKNKNLKIERLYQKLQI